MMDKKYPSVCSDHPKAKIRHSWDTTFVGGGPGRVGRPVHGDDVYECAECGKRLCSPKEYEHREKHGGHFA